MRREPLDVLASDERVRRLFRKPSIWVNRISFIRVVNQNNVDEASRETIRPWKILARLEDAFVLATEEGDAVETTVIRATDDPLNIKH